ncbi:hypothetical protein ACFY5D_18725 [Paeniglutamicibacter sp. NPDC012692]|uniref:hypothetical protein n=1 Tax=Paeniglutamicibacter sp. NPDC012692 TaxID=3364388 RepID=UPI0036B199E5
MATEFAVKNIEDQTRELLDGRVQSIRHLVTARLRITEIQAQLENAEREDARLYAAAQRIGWSTHELRELGITEPVQSTRPGKRSAAKTLFMVPGNPVPVSPDEN